jgi:hypothetical protein
MSGFCPPYSPDFNPIEQAFAKLKAFLRTTRPRTFDRVATLVADALKLFTTGECENYVRHCGYRLYSYEKPLQPFPFVRSVRLQADLLTVRLKPDTT